MHNQSMISSTEISENKKKIFQSFFLYHELLISQTMTYAWLLHSVFRIKSLTVSLLSVSHQNEILYSTRCKNINKHALQLVEQVFIICRHKTSSQRRIFDKQTFFQKNLFIFYFDFLRMIHKSPQILYIQKNGKIPSLLLF